MTPKEKEAYYDAELAPKIMALAQDCKAHGLSFLAVCEFEPGEAGRTVWMEERAGLAIRLADASMRCNRNVDDLWGAIQRHAKKHGHSSVYLHLLGIPEKPSETEESDE